MTDQPWWRAAVCYEIYVRSYSDGDGDGLGDLPGITGRLDHLVELGVDALWLTPFYPSPLADGGYDVADPRDVDPRLGTLADLDALVAAAHERGLRVTVDIVPNHTSDAHPWFQAALAAPPGSPERERYLFRDGRGDHGELPPNNWLSTFGGPAWARVPDGQWYLHLFAPEQPDLNWRNPAVGDDYERTLRFWLDRGVDGFRIDVAHGLFKDAALRDDPGGVPPDLMADVAGTDYEWDQPEVHDVYRRWHDVLADYPGDRMAVGEVWLGDARRLARYVRPDELQQVFNFRLLEAPFEAAPLRAAIDASVSELAKVGAAATWVLSNHDVVRHVTRYGGGETGLRRARAALLLVLALPGSVYLYQGEELGLPEVTDLPESALQDPIWERSGHTRRGRDGCRVPLPWNGDAPPYGFSGSADTWLPMPTAWADRTVAAERADTTSTYSLYRRALGTRRRTPALGAGELEWLASTRHCLLFRRPHPDGDLLCMVNLGTAPCSLPAGRVLLTSTPDVGPRLPVDAAVWVLAEGRAAPVSRSG